MRTVLLVYILLMPMALAAVESSDKTEQQVMQKSGSQGAFKGLFYKVWSKFKTMSPKSERKRVAKSTVTAGIRGAETTTSSLQPYWKDDKTGNRQFMQQLDEFARAQSMADKGELSAAHEAFTGFIEKWPDSDLLANAQFAEAFTMGALGERHKSSRSFKAFISKHPNHPLVEDAKMLIAELK